MKATSITFRSASIADASAVADVILESRRAFVSFAPMAHTEDEVRHWISRHLIPTGGVTVAVRSGDGLREVAGIIAISRDDGTGWIDQLYLHPNFVGKGIGSELIERAKIELGPPIRLYTFQQNHGARRFYERHGFHAIEFGNGSDNEEKCPDILYEWNPSKSSEGEKTEKANGGADRY